MKSANYMGHRTISVGDSKPVAPSAGEARLDVAFCGVCGTDLHIFHGDMDKRVQTPQAIGHEVSATVAEIGEGVTNVAVGDKVAVRPLGFGDATDYDNGFPHVGKNLKFLGIDTPGGMQANWTVPAAILHPLPDGLSLEHGALIEPAAVACHDVRLGEVKAGETCVIIGGGPIGLLIALVARTKGAQVILAEVNQSRLELAQSLGFQTVNPTQQKADEFVREQSKGAMADCVFEVSGSAPGVAMMTQLSKVRGRIVMVAIHAQPKPVDLFQFFWSELRLIGARLYEERDFEEAIELASAGKLAFDALITRISPLDEVQQVFEEIETNPNGVKYLMKCR